MTDKPTSDQPWPPSDLIDRLRELASDRPEDQDRLGIFFTEEDRRAMSEAADELERKDAEIARLREALTGLEVWCGIAFEDYAENESPQIALRIARESLADTESIDE